MTKYKKMFQRKIDYEDAAGARRLASGNVMLVS
jgi:hypothetical protein